MKNSRLTLLFSALVAITAILASCSRQTAAPAVAQPEVVRDVRVVQVSARQLPNTVDAVGTVRAAQSATLSAQVMGTIASVAVREGDHVRAGQTVITIDAAQMAAQVERASAGVAAMEQQVAAAASDAALAQSTLKRYEMLQTQKSVSPQEFDEVSTRARSAAARVAALQSQQTEAVAAVSAARTMQGYTRIQAPFAGVVTERKVDPGAMAAPGVPLLTIEREGAYRLEASVDESLLSDVRVGEELPVWLDAQGDTAIHGRVAQIVPAADAASRSFLVKIDLPAAKGVFSGMFGRAAISHGGSRAALFLPRSAVVTRGSMQGVYVVGPDAIAGLRYVTLGSASGEEVEVLSGLSAADTVVEAPGDRELGGKRIEARP